MPDFTLKRLGIFLTIINVLFFVYYFFISFYSRLFFDDYNSMSLIREMGVWGYLHFVYLGTSGRFVNFFLTGIIFKTIELTKSHFYIPVVFWMVGCGGLYFVFRKML